MTNHDGGYDDGYSACDCFWGEAPGSLVKRFLNDRRARDLRALDLGCGEGKNAYALAFAGAKVTAVDLSLDALRNSRRFHHANIEWIHADCQEFLKTAEAVPYDLVVMYGLLHCLPNLQAIADVVTKSLECTKGGGTHILVAFNDGPQDLSAHPGFNPTLASHSFYLNLYTKHQIVHEVSDIIHETHPHNNIPHSHSLTRIIAEKRP